MSPLNDRTHHQVMSTEHPEFWIVGHYDPRHHWHPECWHPAEWMAYHRANQLNGRLFLFTYRAMQLGEFEVGFYRAGSWDPIISCSTRERARQLVVELNWPEKNQVTAV